MHVIAAKAVAFGEALQPNFRTYMEHVVENCRVMGEGMVEGGLRLVSGGTDNHLCLVDLTPAGVTGKEAEALLDSVGITCNKNTIPNEQLSPFVASGIRRHDHPRLRGLRGAPGGPAGGPRPLQPRQRRRAAQDPQHRHRDAGGPPPVSRPELLGEAL